MREFFKGIPLFLHPDEKIPSAAARRADGPGSLPSGRYRGTGAADAAVVPGACLGLAGRKGVRRDPFLVDLLQDLLPGRYQHRGAHFRMEDGGLHGHVDNHAQEGFLRGVLGVFLGFLSNGTKGHQTYDY